MGVPIAPILGGIGLALAPFTGGATLPLAAGLAGAAGGGSAPVSASRNSNDYAPFIVADSESGLSGIAKLVESLNTNSPYVSRYAVDNTIAKNQINWNYVIIGAMVILGVYLWRR